LRLHYQSRIPIIGNRILQASKRIKPKSPLGHVLQGKYTSQDYCNHIKAWDKATRPMSVFKPGRVLGGAWLDQFISQRKAVCLCPDCVRKYSEIFVRVGYTQRDSGSVTDCDGCGETPVLCAEYYSSILM
jgi:hypothetical protein